MRDRFNKLASYASDVLKQKGNEDKSQASKSNLTSDPILRGWARLGEIQTFCHPRRPAHRQQASPGKIDGRNRMQICPSALNERRPDYPKMQHYRVPI